MEDIKMKKLIIATITLITVFAATSQAHSSDRIVTGTLIGAGSGALIGQAIGGDTESTLLGTAIGGFVGLTASSLHHQSHVSSSVHIGYNSYYPKKYRNNHKGQRYYHPRHHNYSPKGHHYKKSRHYDRRHHYTPAKKVVIKHVYKNNHQHKVTKQIHKKERFHGHHDRSDRGKYSPRHHGNFRNGRSHQR
jgi:uncharacterized protein YcfJ